MAPYALASFVVSDRSQDAYDAALAVAANPGRVHNPFVLFGPTRSGKTHLLYAMNEVMCAAGLKVLRSATVEYVERIIDAVRADTMRQLHASLASVDALLLDDIWIGDKPATMRELLIHFDALLARGAQIVLTTHVAPANFPVLGRWIEERNGTAMALTAQPQTRPPR